MSSFHRAFTMPLSFGYQCCSHFSYVLDAVASHCTDVHGQCIACSLSGSVDALEFVSALCGLVQTARMRGGELPPHVFLHVPRYQLISVLVLWVDACNMLESLALFVHQLVRHGVALAIEYLHLFHRANSCRIRSRVQLPGRMSRALQAFTISGVAIEAQRPPPCIARHEKEGHRGVAD